MRETLTIDTAVFVEPHVNGSSQEYVAVLNGNGTHDMKEELRGPLATLHLEGEEKTAEHLKQFKRWEVETLAAGKPLNGIVSPHLNGERHLDIPVEPQEIVLFQSNDEGVKEHIRRFNEWKDATLAAGKPLNGVLREA